MPRPAQRPAHGMTRRPGLSTPARLALLALPLACADRRLVESTPDDPASTADPGTTAPPDPTTAELAGTSTSGGPPVDPTSSSSVGDDTSIDPPTCDVWEQDCPAGAKCAPVALDGESVWNSTQCVPIAADPDGLDQPCEDLGGPLDGLDTCAGGLICWNVDPDAGSGVCSALCTGSPEAPGCPSWTVCAIYAGGVLDLCIPICDPLLQDCPDSQLCLDNERDGGETFVCDLDASGDEGQVFDPCEYRNACDEGLLCLAPALASECDPAAGGCCLPVCDLGVQPDLCPGQDQTCLPWHEPDAAPPGLEHVGVCGLPA